MDIDANAGVKGVEAEPQQPQLVAARELVSAATRFIVLVDANNVRHTTWHIYLGASTWLTTYSPHLTGCQTAARDFACCN